MDSKRNQLLYFGFEISLGRGRGVDWIEEHSQVGDVDLDQLTVRRDLVADTEVICHFKY